MSDEQRHVLAAPSPPYRGDLLTALAELGVRPRAETRPERVREFVNDLYCYELRLLRARLMRGEFPKITYAGRVRDLRRRYWMLSVPLAEWMHQPQS